MGRESPQKNQEAAPTEGFDASAARDVQRHVQNLIYQRHAPDLIAHALLLDLTIQDAFYNMFIDIPYLPETERARIKACRALGTLFNDIAETLERGNPGNQFRPWRNWAQAYLAIIKEIDAV